MTGTMIHGVPALQWRGSRSPRGRYHFEEERAKMIAEGCLGMSLMILLKVQKVAAIAARRGKRQW